MRRVMVALSLLVSGVVVPVVAADVAHADGPGVGSPWVVSLGDSYISGEAGRWAGNSNNSSGSVDAGGAAAYYDNGGVSETINRCHRSTAAEIRIGGGVNSLNLACSGARTGTFISSDGYFKPGLDFYNGTAGQGQALMLQNFAATHNVKMVVVSIGGNNFNFADIIQSCVSDFLLSPSWWPDYCNDDSSVTANFTATNVTNQTNAITTALNNVKAAMANAGYSTAAYKIVVQTYPSPIPNSTGFRYSQTGYTRQSTGGCGFWNNDANWANATALPKINGAVKTGAANANGAGNVVIMDLAAAFNGRRLCENTVNLMENTGKGNWTAAGAADVTEWISQIRTVSTVFGPYYVQESIHPNYWGEKAIRNCVRQAYNGGAVRGGVCSRSANGLNANGEPIMTLT
ncbi:MAG: hypothetical protein ACOYMR_10510 [Ilumatobacteraceae bacterium]